MTVVEGLCQGAPHTAQGLNKKRQIWSVRNRLQKWLFTLPLSKLIQFDPVLLWVKVKSTWGLMDWIFQFLNNRGMLRKLPVVEKIAKPLNSLEQSNQGRELSFIFNSRTENEHFWNIALCLILRCWRINPDKISIRQVLCFSYSLWREFA